MSCEPLLAALKDCLLRSDCVVQQGHLPSECMKTHRDELPEDCKSLIKASFDCKRGMLDMRKRFRGNAAAMSAKSLKRQSDPPPSTVEPETTTT